MECTDISKFCYSLPLKWVIRGQDLNVKHINIADVLKMIGRNIPVIRSRVYRFKEFNLTFYLELKERTVYLQCGTNGDKTELLAGKAVRIEYAFIVQDGTIRYFTVSDYSRFHTFPYAESFDKNLISTDDNLTVHLLITFYGGVQSTEITEDCIRIMDCESVLSDQFPSLECRHDKFHYSGEVPKLTEYSALEILVQDAEGYETLKAMSCDYLIKNLEASNVLGMLNISEKRGMKKLERACIEFLTKKCTVNSKKTVK